VADLDVAYESLSYEKREKEIKTNQLSKTEKALRDIIYAEELKKFDNRVFKNQLIWYGAIPLCITILTCIGIYYFNNDNQTDYMNFVISIIINIVFWVFTSLIIITPKLRKKSLYEKNLIEKIVETRFENEVN
jgi:predicted neutral ceramidase superfamily lipid hydrolase